MNGDLSIVKGHCSKCPEENAEVKFCLSVTIDGKSVLICIDCLKELITMMNTFQEGEKSAKRLGVV
jgi:hypothetical protein